MQSNTTNAEAGTAKDSRIQELLEVISTMKGPGNMKNKITDLLGKRIKLISMSEDPRPIPSGTLGTIRHIGGGVVNVDWDNGRSLGLVIGEDYFEVVENYNIRK